MAVIETKFSIGDVVYRAGLHHVVKQHPCPDCNGSRKWKAASPAGKEYEFSCPRCCSSFHANDSLSLRYTAHEPMISKLTIGSVRVDTASDSANQYMCVETGVGSGNIYYEEDLFSSEAEALAVSEAKAKAADVEIKWVADLYNRSLSLSDYELTNAERVSNQTSMSQWRSKNLDFWDDIDWAESVDQIKARVEKYRSAS